MIRRLLVVVGLLALIPAAAPAAQSSSAAPVRSDQEILIQLERDWDKAILERDLEFVDSVLAEEFVGTYVDGSTGDKAREMQMVAEFNQRIYASSLVDFTVKVFGDTAVVWFTKRMIGPKNGVEIEVNYRYIDVFVQRDGRWQCVASQATRIAPM